MSFTGHRHKPETIKKIKASITGQKRTTETKKRISQVRTGKKVDSRFLPLMSERMRGSKHHNWKGGLTTIRLRIRNSAQYREWRTAIFERDKYICVLCGKWGGTLNADHHPISFSVLIEKYGIKKVEDALSIPEFWDTKNGRTLCKPCHLKTDSYGVLGRKKSHPDTWTSEIKKILMP